MNKFFTPVLFGLLLFLPLSLLSEDMPAPLPAPPPATELPALPEKLDLPKYAPLAKKSPFTLASATQENADFAKDLVLAGYVRLDNEDYVMVANKTRPERVLVGKKPSPQGYVLEKVEKDPSGDPTKLKARIRKGTETANLSYESIASPAPPPGAAPAAPAPGVAAAPGQVPALPGAAPVPGQAAKAPPVIRRRVIPVPPPSSR